MIYSLQAEFLAWQLAYYSTGMTTQLINCAIVSRCRRRETIISSIIAISSRRLCRLRARADVFRMRQVREAFVRFRLSVPHSSLSLSNFWLLAPFFARRGALCTSSLSLPTWPANFLLFSITSSARCVLCCPSFSFFFFFFLFFPL